MFELLWMVVITAAPTPHPPQISFGCWVEGVKQTGQDKRVHAGSISPRPKILAGLPQRMVSTHQTKDVRAFDLYSMTITHTQKCLESERLCLATRHIRARIIAKLMAPTLPPVTPEEVLTSAFGAYTMLGDIGDPHDQSEI